MKKYRPILLVNTNTKIFIQIINSRFKAVADTLVNKHQMVFIPRRYIAENGLVTQMVIKHATAFSPSSDKTFALLLDKEKAYERVKLDYLERVLIIWGFLTSLVDSVIMMLRNKRITINVNSFMSNCVFKKRGLKQDDHISSILYNLAFEPFPLTLIQDFNYLELKKKLITLDTATTSVNVKVLRSANDIMLSLQNTNDLEKIRIQLQTYCAASNSRINYDKVESILLSGS